MIFWQIDALLQKYEVNIKTPFKDIPQEAIDEILYGSLENIRISKDIVKTSSDYFIPFDGIIKYLQTVMESDESSTGKKWADQFLATTKCNVCDGMRLKERIVILSYCG